MKATTQLIWAVAFLLQFLGINHHDGQESPPTPPSSVMLLRTDPRGLVAVGTPRPLP
jgi:hypothetical protein